MKVVIEMSGTDVLLVKAPDDVEVEVRQLHQDFYGDEEVLEDEVWPGCTYTLSWPLPHKRTKAQK